MLREGYRCDFGLGHRKAVLMLLEGSDMMAAQSKLLFQLNKYYNERVQTRKANIAKTVRGVQSGTGRSERG
ncbi:Hypothetical predicted protein [Octopus vulgaris]|uniref:Uncharacterized protein n=1 Tax=Octopus vulgaris TaxID=6645 RepID=A0AA36FEK3_OCTVU|nr:Hypothetical predicted protein [Octopus vulgaris]